MKALFNLVSALLLVSASAHASVVATVNGRPITLDELNNRYKEGVRFLGTHAPSKKDFLNDLIDREVAVQEAKRLNLQNDPVVQERINGVLYQYLLEKSLGKQVEEITVSDAEAQRFYSQNPEIRTSHIFIGVPQGASQTQEQEARSRIEQIRSKQLKDPKLSFAEVAQRFSEDRTAAVGGDLDYQMRDGLDPDFYRGAVALRTVGAISQPIRTGLGFHIIRLTGIRSWKDVDQAKVKRIAFEERRGKMIEAFIQSLRGKASVSVNQKLLAE